MFTDTYLPAKDGVVTSILLTKRQLEKRGHEVFIFAPEPWDFRDREAGVYYFKSRGFKSYPGYMIPMFPTNKCEILRELDIDLIHTHGLLFMGLRSMFAGRSLDKPVVVTFHTMITDAAKYYARLPIPEWMTNRLFWMYLRELLERADAVVAPTGAIRAELLNYAPNMKRIEVIPTGVDTTRFSPSNDGSEVRSHYGLDGEKVLLHLGRIAWEKNLDLVMKGFERLCSRDRGIRLMVAGEGPARKHYEQVASDLGIGGRTVFTGFVPDAQLPQYYAACDAFTIASKFETQGLAALEAMATGKPVAGINYRAIAELVTPGEDGFLFGESAESCAEAMKAALFAGEDVRTKARQRAETYSMEKSAEKLVELYKYAVNHKEKR